MKVTLDLPDELIKAAKFRALEENRKLKDMVAELLRRGLASRLEASPVPRRTRFPLIAGGHPAAEGEEMTPERVAELLQSDDLGRLQS